MLPGSASSMGSGMDGSAIWCEAIGRQQLAQLGQDRIRYMDLVAETSQSRPSHTGYGDDVDLGDVRTGLAGM